MYNFNHKITYNHVSENKQNNQYQKDLLTCFSVDTYDFEKIGKIQDDLFELYKDNKNFKELLDFFQNNQTIIPAKLPLQNCFTLLFQFEFFFILHKCLIDLHNTDKIQPLNFENMTFLIKKNN
tara:strand:+ start:2215 stop:2583 length:369 start_codon:yes stop_codon:yes gene_type:complete